MQHFPQLAFSVSVATCQPRGMEKDGVDYHFISTEDFKQKIQRNEFIECGNGVRRKILRHFKNRTVKNMETG